MARDIINRNQFLPGYNLTVEYYNGQCSVAGGLQAFIETVKDTDDRMVVGIVGPACSKAAKAIGAVSKFYPLVSVSYGAESSDLSNAAQYPYFLRTAPPSRDIQLAWLVLVKHFGWRRFAVVVQSDYEGFSADTFQKAVTDDDLLNWSDVKLINSFGSDNWNADAVLTEVQESDMRIIIALLIERDARSLFCAATLRV